MLLTGTLTRMVASFAFTIYAADLLGVEGFGKFSIAIHYFELFLSLSATSVGILLTRDVARWPRRNAQLFTSALLLVLALWLLSPPAMWLLGSTLGYSSDTIVAISIASIALLPAAIGIICEALFVAHERAEFVTLGTGVESVARIALSFLALNLGYGLLGLVVVVLIVRTVMLLCYLLALARIGRLQWSLDWLGSYRFFQRWRIFAAENWMATLYTNLDMLLLSWISGEYAAGLYSAAWKIVRLGAVVAKSYTTAIFPVMSRVYAQSRKSFFQLSRESIRFMCMLALPAIAFVFVVPERVMGLLFNDSYSAAASVLQVLIWVLLIEFLNPFLSHALFAQGKQQYSMFVAAISLAINSILTYVLVQQFAEVGAALGTVAGGFVAMVCYLAFTMPREEIRGILHVALRVLGAATGLGLVVFAIRDFPWLLLIPIAAAVYALLLILLGALRVRDMEYFRSTFLMRSTA